MANFPIDFSKTRFLLAILSAISLTLSGPIAYAQDVPTPTPPADGGDFDGAPDPTPGPEAAPEADPVDEPLPATEGAEPIDDVDGIDVTGPAEDTTAPSPTEQPSNSEELEEIPDPTADPAPGVTHP